MADKEGAAKTQRAIVVASYPDVCLAPDKPAPFQIVAHYEDSENVSPDVNLKTYPCATMLTRITRVTGDEAGSGGGVGSGTNEGYCRPCWAYATTVKVNKEFVLRHDTEFEMNCAGAEGPPNTVGKTVVLGGGSSSGCSVGADGEIEGDSDPPPSEELGFWGQVGGFFVGAGKAGWELVEFGGKALQFYNDTTSLAGPLMDVMFGGNVPSVLPSYARGRQTNQQILDTAGAIWENPGLIWEGIKAPYVEAWAAGRYGEFFGRLTVDVGGGLLGPKGLNKLGSLGNLGRMLKTTDDFADVFNVIRRADQVIPEEFARIPEDLLNLGRTHGNLADIIDGARKAGALDDFLALGKLTPDEVRSLVQAGKLTVEEAGVALAAAKRLGGITITKIPKSPNAAARKHAQGEYRDPRTNEIVKTNEPLQADHIYPQSKIKEMPGFNELTYDQKNAVLNNLDNIQGLPGPINQSKWNKMADRLTHILGTKVDPEYLKWLREAQQRNKDMLQKQINAFLGG